MDDTCPKCGGSGGGDDPALRCWLCGETGKVRRLLEGWSLVYDPPKGYYILRAAVELLAEANRRGAVLKMCFNDRVLSIYPGETLGDILDRYDRGVR